MCVDVVTDEVARHADDSTEGDDLAGPGTNKGVAIVAVITDTHDDM